MQFRRDLTASQEAAVSWAVAAHAARVGGQAGYFVVRMSCATDGNAVAAADVAAANDMGVEAVVALVDGYAVHIPGAATGRTDEAVEAAYSVAHLIEYELGTSAKQDSCHFLIVVARIVRAAEGQVVEVVRQNNHCGIPQPV
jgi:hypothetical protein